MRQKSDKKSKILFFKESIYINRADVGLRGAERTLGFTANIHSCSLGFAIGLIFETSAGFYWLEIVDYYLSTVLLVIVGLLEAVAVGYFYGPEILRKFLGDNSEIVVGRWWNYSIKIIVPVMLFFILISIILENINEPYGVYPFYANALGWFIVIIIPVLSIIIALGVQIWHKNRIEKST